MGVLDLGYLNKIANVEEYNEQINALSRAVEVGKNLFNKEAVIDGKYIDASGIIHEHEAYYMIYIPVDININKVVSVRSGNYCALCDINKNIIDGTVAQGLNTSFNITPESKYFLVSGVYGTNNATINGQIVCYGELDLMAGDYVHETKVNVAGTIDANIANIGSDDLGALARSIVRSKNLFNKEAVINDKYIADDGLIKEHNAYTLIYIPVDINVSNIVSIKTGSNCALCDVDKNFIAGTLASGTNASFTLTPESKYIAVTTLKTALNSQIVNYGTLDQQAGDYTHTTKIRTFTDGNEEVLTSNLKDYDRNLIDNSRWQKGVMVVSSTGVVREDQYTESYTSTDWIPISAKVCKNLRMMLRNGITLPASVYSLWFYDEGKRPISGGESVSIGSFGNVLIDIPSEACYMRACIINANDTYGFDAVVKYGCFHFGYLDIKEWSGGTKDNMITPDDIIPYCRFGGTIENPSFMISNVGNPYSTTYIPVKPNTEYFVQTGVNTRHAHFFDVNKKDLGIIAENGVVGHNSIIKTPANAYYVVFSFLDSWWDKNDKTHFIGMVEASKWNGEVGNKTSEDEVVKTSILSGGFPSGRNKVLGVRDNYIAIMSFTGKSIMFSASGWDSKPYAVGSNYKAGGWQEYLLNSDNFPGYDQTLHNGIAQVVFFTKSNGTAIDGIGCLLFSVANNGIWYCSDVTDVSNLTFAVPNIWDMKGNKSWRIDADVDANKKTDSNGVTRYKMYYPSDQASRHGQWMWHNGPLWMEGAGGQYSRGVLFGNYSDHSRTNPSPNCLYYTDNGEDIYVMYEFGATPKRYKVAGDSAVKTRTSASINYCAGDTVDVSDTTLFPSGSAFTSLTMKKRYSIVPSEGTPDPTSIFEYDDTGVAVSSVSGTSFTLADTSGFQVGDIVILEGTATGGYANLLTTSIDGTTKVGNGPVFVITAISGSDVTLADIVGNPKNNLFCRHIHGVTEFGQGICIYTGEEYPESWYVYMNPDFRDIGNGTNPNRNQWVTDTIHLNSSANAFQRALGIILRPDGKCVYIADSNFSGTLGQITKLQVRGKDIKMGNFGVFVFDINDIDDATKAMTQINGVNAGYALYNLGNILFYSDYYGKTYYSMDWGDSWKYICTDGTTKSQMIGWDKNKKRFYFNQTRGSHFTIEVK